MQDTLSLVTKPAMQPVGRTTFRVVRGGKGDANEPEPFGGDTTRSCASFLVAIARELSMAQGGTAAEHLRAARRLLAEAFDAVEASVLSPGRSSPVRHALARVQAGA